MKGKTDFKDEAVVVTGAANGIGREIALAFARQGARLAVADINAGALDKVRLELTSAGSKVYAQVVDVAVAADVESFCDSVYREMGRVDVLCNNAGVAVSGSFEDISLGDWQWIVGINLLGVIHGCHFFYPRMIAQRGGGHIVNIASAAGLFPLPGSIPYSCTKYAVVGLTETLRAEAALHGIGVSAVCPGFVSSGIFTSARQCTSRVDMSHEEAASQLQESLRKRGRTPEKVAAAVLDAVEKNQGVVVRLAEARFGDLLHRLSRRASDLLAARAVVMGEKGMAREPQVREDEAWLASDLDLLEVAEEETVLRH
jgi:NAD(P)-dependent dehydrogenase (short-subunit alcohol dehydrogenase family)